MGFLNKLRRYSPSIKPWDGPGHLRIEALEDCVIRFSSSLVTYTNTKKLYCSLDKGTTWECINPTTSLSNTVTILLKRGLSALFKGRLTTPTSGFSDNTRFSTTARIRVSGYLASLFVEDDYLDGYDATASTYGKCLCANMFKDCANMETAPYIANIDGGEDAFYAMFSGCASLKEMPELPGQNTPASASKYLAMFSGCTSMNGCVNRLPGTGLAANCYLSMFNGCKNVTGNPTLIGGTLPSNCYYLTFCDTKVVPDYSNIDFYDETSCSNCGFLGIFSSAITDEDLRQVLPVDGLGRYYLPITNLTSSCYSNMFKNCYNLTTAPKLPATTLAPFCYSGMFSGCTSLTTAPSMPATTLANSCYRNMFHGANVLPDTSNIDFTDEQNVISVGGLVGLFAGTKVTDLDLLNILPIDLSGNYYLSSFQSESTYVFTCMFEDCKYLTTAPKLPDTVVNNGNYSYMFSGCTSLVNAPNLPADTIGEYAYSYMFLNCTSLANAPTISARVFPSYSCYYMFDGCSSLTNVPDITATSNGSNAYAYMFRNCTSLVNAPRLYISGAVNTRCCNYMFYGCTSLTTVSVMPSATSLGGYCYGYMFYGCRKLKNLPNTLVCGAVGQYACQDMFYGCSSLEVAPDILMTSAGRYCFYCMFKDCESLRVPPSEISATNQYSCQYMFLNCSSLTYGPALTGTLSASCYRYMFYNCTSLVNAPALTQNPVSACYNTMFRGCTSLTTAPDLLATTIPNANCYSNMFFGCSSLSYVKALFTNNVVPSNWLAGVSEHGTFVKNELAEWDEASVVPEGWTILAVAS